MTRKNLRALYEALGGEAGLRAILSDFYARMAGDLLVGFFFAGRDTTTIAERQLEFILKAAGVRSEYAGRAPQQAHLELPPILAGHFDRRMVLLEETLRAHAVPDVHRKAWLAFEQSFRKSIVTRGRQT